MHCLRLARWVARSTATSQAAPAPHRAPINPPLWPPLSRRLSVHRIGLHSPRIVQAPDPICHPFLLSLILSICSCWCPALVLTFRFDRSFASACRRHLRIATRRYSRVATRRHLHVALAATRTSPLATMHVRLRVVVAHPSLGLRETRFNRGDVAFYCAINLPPFLLGPFHSSPRRHLLHTSYHYSTRQRRDEEDITNRCRPSRRRQCLEKVYQPHRRPGQDGIPQKAIRSGTTRRPLGLRRRDYL